MLWGCPAASISSPEAGVADARAAIDGATAPDAAPAADATPLPDAGPEADAEPEADAAPGPDLPALDAGSGASTCDMVARVDGVITGSMGSPRVFLPTSTSAQTLAPIVEASEHVTLGATRAQGHTLAWHAQVSSLTRLGSVGYRHFLVDPTDGAVYAGMEQQLQDTTGIRFYNADGTLFREYTPAGAPGSELIGRSRQSNLFVVKYDARGQIQWISRFGPNSSGDRAGSIASLGFVGDNVRVMGSVEDASRIAFAAGTPSAFERAAPSASVFWGELSKADGSYVTGSARFVDATSRTSRPTHSVQAHHAHSSAGETAMQLRLSKASQPLQETFTLGALGARPVTVTATRSIVAFVTVGADGEPTLKGTLSIPQLFGDGADPRAVALGPAGQLVAGGQFPGSQAPAYFRGVSGQARLDPGSGHSYLVAFAADGALSWVKEIPGERNAISRIVVTAEAVFVLGTHAAGDQLDGLTVPATGYTLTRHDLTTGDAEWLRVFTSADGMSIGAAYELWPVGGELVVPSAFTGLRVVGEGVDRVFRPAASSGVLGAIYVSSAGDVLRCEAVATAAALRHF